MGQTTKLEQVEVARLRPYERNAKLHPQDQIEKLKRSIEEFGFLSPCLIDKDGNIIAGHGRVQAAKELGLQTVPCVYVEGLTDEQRRAYILADNRLTELGGWNMSIVEEELDALTHAGIDATITGFDWDAATTIEPIEDEYDSGDEKAAALEPIVNRGDIWKLGDHRLMCGDATSAEDVAALMDGERASIAFTSPPYNAGTSERLSGNTHMIDSKYIGNDDDLDDWVELIRKSSINMIESSEFTFVNIQMLANNKTQLIQWLYELRGHLCDAAIWKKTTTAPAMAARVMNSQFEFVFIFSKENNSRAIGTKDFRGTISNVFECMPQRQNAYSDIHAATFPIALPSHFIANFSNSREIVLDVFGGTGTTMIAAEQLGRRCYMMELDPHYCDVIIDRWEEFTGRKAEKI